jgi:SAM-dependent methyltransferase
MTIDPAKLDAFMGRFVGDLGAVMHAPLIILGDRLGLYAELAKGPATPGQLAERAKVDARYAAEWLAANAASGYVEYDAPTERYAMSAEQAFALSDPSSPAYIPGAFLIALSTFLDLEKIQAAFRSGAGLGWGEHHHCLFDGTEKFFRPGYQANLVSAWLPALDGMVERLQAGAAVADVGCGYGASTIVMAKAFPRSTFRGFDFHPASIDRAREAAAEAGVSDRVTFEVASAKDFPGSGYALVTCFDCLHDLGDPVGAARHVRTTLAAGGTWMIVEPFAHDHVHENLNPVGRVFYSVSTTVCTMASRAQEGGLALGAQAGQARLERVLREGGFSRVRRATETPFNLVLEARA